MGGRSKAVVASSPATAFQQYMTLARVGEILDLFSGIGVSDQGSCGDLYDEIFAIFSGLAFPLTGFSVLCPEPPPMPKWVQSAPAIRCLQDHISAPSSITAVWPAARNELFASEADASPPAVAGLCGDDRLINEFHSA
jgi:hypothetical protein